VVAAVLVLAPSSLGSSRSHEVKIVGGPSGRTTETNATFTFEVPAGYGPPECSLDGGPFDGCVSPRTYLNLPLGNHTFTVRATTTARIPTTDSDMRSWTIVAAPPPKPAPETTITSGPANPTNATTASFAFTASIGGSTFKCRIDGGIFAACLSPAAYSGLTAGSHTFEVFASADGVDDLTPASRTWIVDTTAPTASMVLPNATFTLETTFLVSWTGGDAESNVASFDLSYRQAHWNGDFNGRPPLWLDNTTDADAEFTAKAGWTYCFKVRATDLAGNLSDFSPERCTALPVPAATLHVERGLWFEIGSQGSYLNTLQTTQVDHSEAEGLHRLPVRRTRPLRPGLRPVRARLQRPSCQGRARRHQVPGLRTLLLLRRQRRRQQQEHEVHRHEQGRGDEEGPDLGAGEGRAQGDRSGRRISIAVWDGRPRIEGIGISRAPILRAG
jgi:hypothetical protein